MGRVHRNRGRRDKVDDWRGMPFGQGLVSLVEAQVPKERQQGSKLFLGDHIDLEGSDGNRRRWYVGLQETVYDNQPIYVLDISSG